MFKSKSKRTLCLSAIFALFLVSGFLTPKIALASEADNFCLNNTTGLFAPCIFPNGTQAGGASQGTTGVVNAFVGGTAGKISFICGFDVTATATVAAVVQFTLTGTTGGTKFYQIGVPASPAVVIFTRVFTPCVPATATNTNIQASMAAVGVGGIVDVNVDGFQQ